MPLVGILTVRTLDTSMFSFQSFLFSEVLPNTWIGNSENFIRLSQVGHSTIIGDFCLQLLLSVILQPTPCHT